MGTALVTGATAGLGLEFAWQLATARHNLVLVARDEARLEQAAEQIRAAAGVDVEVLRADLSLIDDVERVAARLRVTDPNPVGLLVNNAGYGIKAKFIDDSLDAELKALDVMVRAVMVLSHAAAGQMKQRGRGAILNVGSVAALMATGTYSAHKAWVRTFTESLAAELAGTGVVASVVAPGLTHTEFHRRMNADTSALPELAWLEAPRVVSDALAGLRRRVVLNTPSLRYKAASALLRLAPRPVVRAIGRARPY